VALNWRTILRLAPAARSQQPWPGLFGKLGDLVRCKEAGYLTEQESTAVKVEISGIGGP